MTEIVDRDMDKNTVQNKWLRIQSNYIPSPTDKPRIALRYERSGLLPTFQAKTLALDEVVLQILDGDMKLHIVTYPAPLVLQYGQNHILDPK